VGEIDQAQVFLLSLAAGFLLVSFLIDDKSDEDDD